MDNRYPIILTFIIIIVVVLMSDNLVIASIIIALLTNFVVISSCISKITKGSAGDITDNTISEVMTGDANTTGDVSTTNTVGTVSVATASVTGDADNDMTPIPNNEYGPLDEFIYQYDSKFYGDAYADWNSYRNIEPQNDIECNLDTLDGSILSNNVDTGLVRLGRQRARDKRCIDGYITKNVNYYKYHFANELNEVEDKPWWGREEY